MNVLITGCERSGTTYLLKAIEGKVSEFKPVIAAYRFISTYERFLDYSYLVEDADKMMFEYLMKQYKTFYKDDELIIDKHSLNLDQNIGLLKFIKRLFPHVNIIYLIRDGRDVVTSMVEKIWGRKMQEGAHRKTLVQAVLQWVTVIENTYDWAKENASIIRYEQLGNYNTIDLPGINLPVNNEFKLSKHNPSLLSTESLEPELAARFFECMKKTGY